MVPCGAIDGAILPESDQAMLMPVLVDHREDLRASPHGAGAGDSRFHRQRDDEHDEGRQEERGAAQKHVDAG
jgi:hypothetical protein